MFLYTIIHKQTWILPCRRVRNQIDLIVIDYQIRSGVQYVRNMKGSVLSVHYLMKIKLKFNI